MHVPACGKAEGKTTYHTGGSSIVPLSEKALHMIVSYQFSWI